MLVRACMSSRIRYATRGGYDVSLFFFTHHYWLARSLFSYRLRSESGFIQSQFTFFSFLLKVGVGAAPTVLFVSVEVTRGENVSIERDGEGRVGDNITCNIKSPSSAIL